MWIILRAGGSRVREGEGYERVGFGMEGSRKEGLRLVFISGARPSILIFYCLVSSLALLNRSHWDQPAHFVGEPVVAQGGRLS